VRRGLRRATESIVGREDYDRGMTVLMVITPPVRMEEVRRAETDETAGDVD